MKGDDAYAHKYQNLEERSSELSAYEIVQTIIGINLLIVSVVSACIVELKKDNKKKTIFSFGWWYCTQKVGQNIKLFWFSILNFKVSKFYYF